MKRPHSFIVAASIALAYAATAIPAAAAPVVAPAALDASNPFAKVSTLPFHYPAFDKIKDEHFKPAFDAGMRVHLLEIDAIAANHAAPTFQNTIVAMERACRPLSRTCRARTPTTISMRSTARCRRSWPPTRTRST
jgi:peptidyl-dipeptidase Dcp